MNKNINKLNFGYTINNLDSRLPKSRGRCFDYGIISGCDEHCPALLDGECKEPKVCIDGLKITKEEKSELYKLYQLNN